MDDTIRLKVCWDLVEDQDINKMFDDIQKSEGFDEWCQRVVDEALEYQLKLMGA